MSTVDYEEDRTGIAEMLRAPFMVDELRRIVDLIRVYAEAIAPVDTGAYAFGLPGEPDVTGGAFVTEAGVDAGVAYGRMSNDVRRGDYAYGVALEFGNRKIKPQRVIGRAVSATRIN